MNLDPKDFFDWIKQQDDDKPVDMCQNIIVHECGCLLVQYGKHLNLDFAGCGFDSIGTHKFERNDMSLYGFIVDAIDKNIKTFKEAKELYDNKRKG